MNGMDRTFIRIGQAIAAFVTIAFLVFLINQTAAVVQLASSVSPAFGQLALWGLIALYGLLVAVPIVLLLRLPKPLRPPAARDAAAVERYEHELTARLRKNRRLAGQPLESRDDLQSAIDRLEAEADRVVSTTAGSIFVSTAISQYGRLDAFVVLAAQTKMIWEIAHIFYQRPTIRDMLRLYANVGSTVFIASEIDDVDIAEQVEPMISSVLGSVVTSVPGMQAVAGVIVNSALTGSANAFLTLRVGVITKKYCAALVEEEKRDIKRSATVEAVGMLRSIAASGTRTVAVAIAHATRDKFKGALDTAKHGVLGARGMVFDAGATAVTGVGTGLRTALDAGDSAVRGVGRGIRSGVDAVGDAVEDTVGGVSESIKRRVHRPRGEEDDEEERTRARVEGRRGP